MKKLFAVILALCMTLSLCACGGSADSGASNDGSNAASGSGASNPEYEWTLAHHLAEQSQQHKSFVKFADDVFEKSGGRIKINVSFGAALGSQRELIEQVNLGTIEMALSEASLYANYSEEFSLICMPFLFENEDQYIQVASASIGDKLNEILMEDTNMRNVAWIYGGTRDIYSSKPIQSMDDLAALKIRTPESTVFVESFKAMGANPTPVAANEMYTALQQGVVEAMEGSLETGYTYKIYEVAKNCFQTCHILAGCALAMNEDVYDRLPADLQAVIDECAVDMTAYCGELVAESNDYYYGLLSDEGVNFVELSPEEREKAKNMVADFSTAYIGDNSVMMEMYKEILEAAK